MSGDELRKIREELEYQRYQREMQRVEDWSSELAEGAREASGGWTGGGVSHNIWYGKTREQRAGAARKAVIESAVAAVLLVAGPIITGSSAAVIPGLIVLLMAVRNLAGRFDREVYFVTSRTGWGMRKLLRVAVLVVLAYLAVRLVLWLWDDNRVLSYFAALAAVVLMSVQIRTIIRSFRGNQFKEMQKLDKPMKPAKMPVHRGHSPLEPWVDPPDSQR